jgi:FxsC-like protein
MTDDQRDPLAPYFFLSYARSDPLAGQPRQDPDHLVERFFRDLTAAVQDRASRAAETVSGFFDQRLPVGSDLKQSIAQALSAAQVFVPLYSVSYLANSWPGREFTCFKWRMELAGRVNAAPRLVPVLWAPLPGVSDPPGLADAPAVSAVPDYAENGLRRLLTLQPYHDLYLAVVSQIAKQIVDLAERDPVEPVEPSQVPDIETVPSAFSPDAPLAIFNIQVAAPTAGHGAVPGGGSYGDSPLDWRPFAGQELPLVEYARQIARRFDFDARVSVARPAADPARQRPGIIIIDPAFAADERNLSTLRSLAGFPRWVLPLVVLGEPDNPRTQQLASKVRAVLKDEDLPTESARRGARGVDSLDQFRSIFPVLVAEAERQYMRHRSGRVPTPRSTGRPRLGPREEPAGGYDANSDSLGRRDA